MAYIDDVPPVWNTWRLYESAKNANADTRLLLLGDSKSSPEATGAPLGHGILRTWNVGRYSFVQARARYQGGAAWLSNGLQPAGTGLTGRTNRDPGVAYSGGENNFLPCNGVDIPFTGNMTSGQPYSQMCLVDTANYATVASPFSSTQMTARQTYYLNPTNSIQSIKIRSIRYAGSETAYSGVVTTVNTTTVTMNSGTPGMAYTDVDGGTGANTPGVDVFESGDGTDETGKYLYLGPPVLYRGTPGSRVTGFGIGHIATGGHKTADLLAVLGGGASPTCTIANVRWYLQNACFTPNFVLVDIGQNLNSGAETNELTAGTSATFRTNYNAFLDQLNTVYDGISGASRPFVVLVNPTRSGYTDTHVEAKGRCIFQIARERGYGFLDMIQLMTYNGTGNGWWTRAGDDVHYTGPAVQNHALTGNGCECVAAAMWGAMAGEYHGRQLASAVRARVR